MRKLGRFFLRSFISLWVVFSFVFAPFATHATITSLISYQAKLTDTNNVAIADAAYTIKFRIYAVSSGGTALYAEQQSITTANGLFNALIGSGTLIESSGAISAVDFNQDPLYLGVQVGADAEMTPRKRIAASIFAFNANKVGGKSETEFALLAGRAGGQTLSGGNAAGENLTLQSTASSTKGKIFFGANSAYDEVNTRFGVGTSTPSAAFEIKGLANITQLLVRATTTQSNANPLFKAVTSSSAELFRLHSDDPSNLFLGASAGLVNNSGGGGTRNVFLGTESGAANTTGSINTATGRRSLFGNTTGANNSAFGDSALVSNTSGGLNTAVGGSALNGNTSGGNNNAFGSSALFSNTTGGENVGIGFNALYSNTTASQNIALGNQAGYLNVTGSRNVFLGYKAGYSETGSDKLYISNSSTTNPLIYGDFATGRVGIGITSTASSSILDVYHATSTPNLDIFRILTNVTSTGNVVFRVDSEGDVFSDGTFSPGGADFAENYIGISDTLQAGDIVSLRGETLGVDKSGVAYDKKMLGVISEKPGVALAGNLEKGVPVALSGRVPVHVSLENGPIYVGDPITSSNVAGVGMKATKTGKIVGYALEDYLEAKDTNACSEPCRTTILVFINLGYHLADDAFSGVSSSEDSAGFVSSVKQALAAFTGIVKTAGTWIFDTIETTFLGVKHLKVENGITIKDKVTGEYYCMTVQSGVVVSEKGACDTSEPSVVSTVVSDEGLASVASVATSSSSLEQASSSPEVVSRPEGEAPTEGEARPFGRRSEGAAETASSTAE